jgi:hypothetical protein
VKDYALSLAPVHAPLNPVCNPNTDEADVTVKVTLSGKADVNTTTDIATYNPAANKTVACATDGTLDEGNAATFVCKAKAGLTPVRFTLTNDGKGLFLGGGVWGGRVGGRAGLVGRLWEGRGGQVWAAGRGRRRRGAAQEPRRLGRGLAAPVPRAAVCLGPQTRAPKQGQAGAP